MQDSEKRRDYFKKISLFMHPIRVLKALAGIVSGNNLA
jgi:hypothetical protein